MPEEILRLLHLRSGMYKRLRVLGMPEFETTKIGVKNEEVPISSRGVRVQSVPVNINILDF